VKIKAFIQKLQVENKEFKSNTTLMKSQDEELKELRKTIEAWKATEIKWAKCCSITNNNMKLWVFIWKH
jgi:hypothetical protein